MNMHIMDISIINIVRHYYWHHQENEEMPAVSDVEVIVQCIKCCMQAIFAYTYRSQDSVHNSCMSQRLRMQFPVKL